MYQLQTFVVVSFGRTGTGKENFVAKAKEDIPTEPSLRLQWHVMGKALTRLCKRIPHQSYPN
jgi:hypothetical protein